VAKPLHTYVALRKGVQGVKTRELTAAHRTASESSLYEGQTRTYRPRNEDGDVLPPENKNIRINGDGALNALVQAVARDWNLMATVDRGNQASFADVEVPTGATTAAGEPVYRTVLSDVPVQFLLYLARELDDVRKYVAELPTLDPGVPWTYDEAVAAYVAEPVETNRTEREFRNHQVSAATKEHAEKVHVYEAPVTVGVWTLIRRSGALPLERKARLLQRIETLRAAVTEAHQRAGQVTVEDVEVARPLFDYLLGDDAPR